MTDYEAWRISYQDSEAAARAAYALAAARKIERDTLRAMHDQVSADAQRWRFVEDNPWRAIDLLRDKCSTHPAIWGADARNAVDEVQ